MAATESFRRQFNARQDGSSPQRSYTYHTNEARHEDESENIWSSHGALPEGRRSRATDNGASTTNSSSVALSSSHLPKLTQVGSPTEVKGTSPKTLELPLGQTSPPSFGTKAQTGGAAQASSSAHGASMTLAADALISASSTPTLALVARAPAVRTNPGRQWPGSEHISPVSSHVDLVEAAKKIKAQKQQSSLGILQGPTADSEEPSSILQIGRHTYVRSTDDFRTTLLAGQVRGEPGGVHSIARPGSLSMGRRSTRHRPLSARPLGLSMGQEILFVLIICLAQMLMLAGIAQALVPASIIGKSFHDTTPGTLAWSSAAYGLTAGTFVLPAGRLGDLFGHKKLFITGFLWFAVWSCVAGFAEMVEKARGTGTVFFCFSRAMQGIGPALLVPNGQAMLGRVYRPGPRKNTVMSLFGAAAPLGFVLGAVVASLFAVKASWPWAFWSMGAVCLALAPMGMLVVPSSPQPKRAGRESLWMQLDCSGMALGVCGLVLFNFAFNQAPIVSWTTPYTYFILIIAVMLLAAFAYAELVAPHPLVPIAAMRGQTNFVLGCTAAGWASFSIWVYYAFATLQRLRGWSPLLSSAAFAHAPVSGFVASMLTGYLMGKVKPQWIMFISMCAFFVGSLLLVTAPVEQSYWRSTFSSVLLMPFGMDMSNPAANILLSNSVSKAHQGIAASLVVTVVNYSISLALGIGGTIEVNTNHGGRDVLAGYRGAQFFGLGLGALGVVLAAAFLLQSYSKTPLTGKV